MSKFIKWTSTDEQGTFSHVGQQLSNNKKGVSMLLADGSQISFPQGDGTVESVNKPRNWTASVSKDVKPSKIKTKRTKGTSVRSLEKKARKAKKGTKKEKALKIVAESFIGGKDATIKRLMDELEMTTAGATTYFYSCKKELGLA